jgi:hypothetical protein
MDVHQILKFGQLDLYVDATGNDASDDILMLVLC